MRGTRNLVLAVAFWLTIATGQLASADEITDKGRDILNKNQHAVVTVQVVIKMNYSVPGMGSQGNEFKEDLTGTVVDPSGLTVLALSTCDPSGLMQSMLAGMAGDDWEASKLKRDS